MTTEDYGLARRMWHQLEPIHAMFWYAPEVFAEAVPLEYSIGSLTCALPAGLTW